MPPLDTAEDPKRAAGAAYPHLLPREPERYEKVAYVHLVGPCRPNIYSCIENLTAPAFASRKLDQQDFVIDVYSSPLFMNNCEARSELKALITNYPFL